MRVAFVLNKTDKVWHGTARSRHEGKEKNLKKEVNNKATYCVFLCRLYFVLTIFCLLLPFTIYLVLENCFQLFQVLLLRLLTFQLFYETDEN